jgi:hypothetical protein
MNTTTVSNLEELADEMGCTPGNIAKALFKGTKCGIGYASTETGISVCGYAEGSDETLPEYHLDYQFTMQTFWELCELADEEGCTAWYAANIEHA